MKNSTDASIDAMLELVNGFNFERVEKVMIALDWKWAMGKELRTPTVDEMRDKCFNLLIVADRDKDTISTGGFQASCKVENDRKYFTLKFIAAQDYSYVSA